LGAAEAAVTGGPQAMAGRPSPRLSCDVIHRNLPAKAAIYCRYPSGSEHMSERNTTTQSVRDRLTGLLADWGAEMSSVLKELDEKRARLVEFESGAAGRQDELQTLQKRLDGQQNLIDALRGDAEEVSKIRSELRSKDLDFERINSELDSKKELIRALRRDAEGMDRLKADAKVKDRDIEELRAQLKRVEAKAEQSGQELVALREAAAGRASEEQSELETLRAELEARKTLVKSLRADQERVTTLQASLEEKRETIEQLEASMNRHSNTVAELRRSAEHWKRKYHSL
jgi:DNA repair exonuclease SbcCD ATPase subunit